MNKSENLDLRHSEALELKFSGLDSSGEISGYASTFGGEPDAYGDVIAAGAFTATLAEHKAAGTVPVMLWSHDPAEPIGQWTDLVEDRHGLKVAGRLNLRTKRGREAHALLMDGDVSGLSIGYHVARGDRVPDGSGYLLKKIDLAEISVVALPANPSARVTGVKSIGSKAELVDMLRKAGLAKGAAIKIAGGGWPALASPDETLAVELLDRIQAARGELKSLKGSTK